MQALNAADNPFALMMDAQSVMQAVARLDLATQKTKRICRPLDKPVAPKDGDSAAAFDKLIDRDATFD